MQSMIPAHIENVAFEEAAVDDIVQRTGELPYFLQEWGQARMGCRNRKPDYQKMLGGVC